MPVLPVLLLSIGAATASPQVDVAEIASYLPARIRITVDADPDSLEYPRRTPKPLFNLTFEDTTRKINPHGEERGSQFDMHPTFILNLYPLSREKELREIIRVNQIHSDCIPIFFARNDRFVVLTSPCFHNRGCYSEPCKVHLYTVLDGLKRYFSAPANSPKD